MSDDNDTGNGAGQTFTQADVDRIVRDRIARERAKYADYDDLKERASEADKSKTALERIEAKLGEQIARADRAERESLIRDVAAELGVPVKVARKFEGKTRDELLADGRETLTEMGIEPDKGKRSNAGGKPPAADKDDTDAEDKDEADTDAPRGRQQAADDDGAGSGRPATGRRVRPMESLRSGAPGAGRDESETLNPLKLVENVRRG